MLNIYRKLGELLLANEVIDSLQLSIGLAAQQTSSRRLGEILVERGFANEDQIAACLAQQYGYPVADLDVLRPEPEALALIPVETALEWLALPVSVSKRQLTVIIADPINVELTDHMTERFDKHIALHVAPESKLKERILEAYGLTTPKARDAESLGVVPPRFTQPVPHSKWGSVSVYEAHDADLNRPVSLFAVPKSDEDYTNHCDNVRAIASAASTHVCPVYDSFLLGDVRWTVTPPVRGETLENLLRTRGRRTVAQAAEIVAGIALGVDAINQISGGCGLVCAANVLVGPEGNFLAPFAKPSTLYIAPEVLAGGTPTPASDTYSLGVLMMQCVTGPSFGSEESLDPRAADVPPALRELFAACLATDPNRRIGSAVELASELQSFDWTVLSREEVRTNTMSERDVLLRSFAVTEKDNRTFWSRLFGRGESARAA